MSIRSQWTDFDKLTRKYIKKRDKDKCVICGKKGALQIMHIFLNRSHGGKGSKENGCLGCIKCHQMIDNPIGNNNYQKGQEYLSYCKKYLQEKENFVADKDFIESLKYKKQLVSVEKPKDNIKLFDRCKDCSMLVKKTNKNNSIGFYYCRYRKMRINKTTKACKSFKKEVNIK